MKSSITSKNPHASEDTGKGSQVDKAGGKGTDQANKSNQITMLSGKKKVRRERKESAETFAGYPGTRESALEPRGEGLSGCNTIEVACAPETCPELDAPTSQPHDLVKKQSAATSDRTSESNGES